MDVWGNYEFSSKTKDILNEICLKQYHSKMSEVSDDWLALLKYNSSSLDTSYMEVDITDEINPKEEEVFNLIKEALENDRVIPEAAFMGISVNSMSRIFSLVKSFVDEFRFCSLCKSITFWNYDGLIKLVMTTVVLPKLIEIVEASACTLFSMKELAISKPHQFCQNVLVPLLFRNAVPFTDIELLKRVFIVLPNSQKDMLILNFYKKDEFLENDWLLLHPLIKELSQNSLLNLLECIQKFSNKFTKSQVFGRFLVNFCKNLDVIGNKSVLKDIIENHQTLLKFQAIKYLELI